MHPFAHGYISVVMLLQPGLDVQQSQEGHECQSHGWWEKGASAGLGGRKQRAGGTQHIPKASLGTDSTESSEPTCPSPEGSTVPCPGVSALAWS